MLPQTLKLRMIIPNTPFTTNCELKQKFSLTQKPSGEQSVPHSQNSHKTKQPVRHTTVNLIQHLKMHRRTETRGFKGGFIPSQLKNTDPNEQNTKTDTQWQGSSDRKENNPKTYEHRKYQQRFRMRES